MVERTIAGLMLVVAMIHVLPLAGFFGPSKLVALYGIDVKGTDLEILMRHRAVLFGILGGLFGYAAFVPAIQPLAFVAAAVSLGSFFFLASSVGGGSRFIRKIVIADVVATACLAGAVALYATKSLMS
jgi:hypothetical protein